MAVFVIGNRTGVQPVPCRIFQPCGHIIDLCRKLINKPQRGISADRLHAQRMHLLADTVGDLLSLLCFLQKCHPVFCLTGILRPGDCYGCGTGGNPVSRMGVAPKIKSVACRIQRYGNTVFIKSGAAQVIREIIVAAPKRRHTADLCNGHIGGTCRVPGGSPAQRRSVFTGIQAVERHKGISVKAYRLLCIHIEIIYFDLRPRCALIAYEPPPVIKTGFTVVKRREGAKFCKRHPRPHCPIVVCADICIGDLHHAGIAQVRETGRACPCVRAAVRGFPPGSP